MRNFLWDNILQIAMKEQLAILAAGVSSSQARHDYSQLRLWSLDKQAFTRGKIMELGMRAQLIPTHRQFKAQ